MALIDNLPRLYKKTWVIEKIKAYLSGSIPCDKNNNNSRHPTISIVHAPTGMGKTVACSRLIAEEVARNRSKGIRCIGKVLMPYRVSVNEMARYLTNLNTIFGESYEYGSAVGGDVRYRPTDDVVLQTVGYFLQGFVRGMFNPSVLQLVMLDEAHDSSWQTDLAIAYLMKAIKEGANIRLIVSSATLDVQKIEKQYDVNVNLISVEETEEEKRHLIEFNSSRNYLPIVDQKISSTFYKTLTDAIWKIFNATTTGNILIMMPGSEEIDRLIECLRKLFPNVSNVVVVPLHSQLSKEDIQFAINGSGDPDMRYIIIATNIVENAITINGLTGVIDSCLRKEYYVDKDGVGELRIVMASRTNIIQAYGRCGRQGVQGIVYITISEEMYDTLPQFSLNEVERNPLYPQLMMIIRNGHNPYDVLSHVQTALLDDDLDYLERFEMIEKNDDGSYRHTEAGEIISMLPCGIRIGKFIFNAIKYADVIFDPTNTMSRSDLLNARSMFFHYTCLVASWVENGNSVFERVSRRPTETIDEYETRKEDATYLHERFYGSDCIETLFKVFFGSFESENLYEWCHKNGIFYKTLIEIERNAKDIQRVLEDVVQHRIYTEKSVYDFVKDMGRDIYELLSVPLVDAFSDSVFYYGSPPRKNGQNAEYLPKSRSFTSAKYVIDRSAKSLLGDNRPPTSHILALNIRRKGTMHFMTHIVCFNEVTEKNKVTEESE